MNVDRPTSRLPRAVQPGVLLVLLAGSALLAQAPDPGPPAWLEVEPNAIEDPAQWMAVEVGGIPLGQTVRLQVLQDCNLDGRPELQGQDGCVSPLADRQSVKAGSGNVVSDRLSFQEVDKELAAAGKSPLPRQRTLWLRASRPGSSQGRQILFKLVEKKDVCSLWQTTVATFFADRCSPGLLQALRRHRGVQSAQPETLLEARRIDVGAEGASPVPVARTRGATGVAWADADTLLVTTGNAVARLEAAAPESTEAADPSARPLSAGLWRVPLSPAQEPWRLWEPPAGDPRQPVAPLALPGGRIAFARQSPGEEAVVGEEPASFLSVWENGRLDSAKDVALPYKIHQLVGSDARGQLILALSLGVGANRPTFLQIDLAAGTYENLGYHHALYHAALRAPGGKNSVVTFEDNFGRQGWELVLVDGNGTLLKGLQTRAEDDLLPAWRPGGREVAFLAEVEAKRERR